MPLSKKSIDYFASAGFTFEEINRIKIGMKDAREWRVLSFEDGIKKIKKGNPVSYV